jgi:hypothetical protein
MDWILIGVVSGSLITATFKDKEACMGRVSTLHDAKIEAKCVEAPKPLMTFYTGTVCLDGFGVVSCVKWPTDTGLVLTKFTGQ